MKPVTAPTTMPDLFACERLSARLTVRSCGLRYMRVRSSEPGRVEYDSACDGCPIGEHHATHGTLSPELSHTPATTAQTTETDMSTTRYFTDDDQKAAAKRVLVGGEARGKVAADLGVSGTSVSNWARRWGHEVAGAAMDAAAAKPPRAKEVAQARASTQPVPYATAPATQLADHVLATVIASAPSVLPPTCPPPAQVVLNATHATLEALAAELSYAVCHIAHKRTRDAVADAAWLLTQAVAS